MLSPNVRRSVNRIIPFGIIWLIFGTIYTQVEKGLLSELLYYPATGNPYNFARNAIYTPVSAMITGLFLGALEIVYFNKVFKQKSFGKRIFYKSILYLVFIVVFLFILTAIVNAIELQTGFFHNRVWKNVFSFFTSYAFFSVSLYMAAIIIVSQFYNEVSENLGQGVLNNFFMGTYNKPIEEERIFMFLDMRSSTTIAESLGHVKYFNLLREYYADLSEPIIRYSGEVYQYAGDEIIVSWQMAKGLQDNHCIRCFFAMKESLEKRRSHYLDTYGLLPGFKAGFHNGSVTTGEIGVIKKEIIFTGDVLNASARIQGLCNQYGVDILLSGHLLKKLDIKEPFQVRSFGKVELKGKDHKIELFTISLG
jgi:class 3 adenylate cyclase